MSEQIGNQRRGTRLTETQLNEFQYSLETLNFNLCVKLLQDYQVNYKTISQLRSILSSLSDNYTLDWGLKLLKLDIVHIIIGGIFLERAKIWNIRLDDTKNIIKELALHDDWRIRKVAIDILRKSLTYAFEKFLDLLVEFIVSENPFNRRVAVSAAKEIASLNEKHNLIKEKTLQQIEVILYEKNPYVITVACDALANGFLRFYADETKKWSLSKAKTIEDSLARACLISIYSTPTVSKHINDALLMIDLFLNDDNEKVRHARSLTLRQIAKHDPAKLSSWLESKMHIRQVVDHWAELEVEGLLGTKFI